MSARVWTYVSTNGWGSTRICVVNYGAAWGSFTLYALCQPGTELGSSVQHLRTVRPRPELRQHNGKRLPGLLSRHPALLANELIWWPPGPLSDDDQVGVDGGVGRSRRTAPRPPRRQPSAASPPLVFLLRCLAATPPIADSPGFPPSGCPSTNNGAYAEEQRGKAERSGVTLWFLVVVHSRGACQPGFCFSCAAPASLG